MNEENELGFVYQDSSSEFDTFSKNIRDIQSRMQDDKSKDIFENRLMYSMTSDPRYMRRVILDTDIGERLYSKILAESVQKKDIYIYGAGRRGKRLVGLFPEIEWKAFIDEKKIGSYQGIDIKKIGDINIHENMVVIVSILNGYEQVRDILISYGINESQIIVMQYFDLERSEDIYFDLNSIGGTIDKDKYFIDAGCYDGKDTINYMRSFFGDNQIDAKVIAFEPDENNYELCKKNLTIYKNIEIRKTVLSNEDGIVHFNEQGSEGSCIDVTGKNKIISEKLDNVIDGKEVGMIKMDIEGGEIDALLGAKNLICTQHPNLAISIYHKRSDIYKIPHLLLEMNPDYKFYLRHYTVNYSDTVLYAVN